jgi:hypothetical protein
MGMCDEIQCDYPVPDPEVQDRVFHTKSLDSGLDRYTITRDGRLILHQVRYESVPEEERPYFGTPHWADNPVAQTRGCMRAVPVGDVEVPHHGDILLYTSIGEGHEYKRFEYRTRFTEGRVQWITREPRGYQ